MLHSSERRASDFAWSAEQRRRMSKSDPFGELLRLHRISAGFSQADLARRARVSPESIGALERGVRRAPYRATVAQLAVALGLSQADTASLEEAAAEARVRTPRAARLKPQHNLPLDVTSFVGRDDDIAEILALLNERRCVTIIGSGGVGKTRTVLEMARRFGRERSTDVWFADLSPLHDGSLIGGKIASSLRPPLDGAFESIGALANALASRCCLLILDNCEHIIADAARAVHELLQSCPDVVVAATSRERLNFSGETVFRLPSLALPSAGPITIERAREYASVQLFMDRAEAAGARASLFADDIAETVVEICRRLDGIPLAIELAAAALPALGIAGLHARLVQSFSTLGNRRDVPQRQQTMLATIAWSFSLLNRSEALLLQRLAIFTGGFTLAAAESVCAEPPLDSASISHVLSSLVDKSLVTVVHEDGRTRYAMLESVREFGLGHLEAAGERDTVALHHARWVASLARSLRPRELAEVEKGALAAVELENVRAALEWCRVAPSVQNRGLAASIVVGLQSLWMLSGRNAELVSLCRSALDNIDDDAQAIDAAILLGILIGRTWTADCRALIERARPIFDRVGKRQFSAHFHSLLAIVYIRFNDFTESELSVDRAMRIVAEDGLEGSLIHADIIANRGSLRSAQGRYDDARADLTQAAAMARELGMAFFVFAICLPRLAEVEQKAGNLKRAIEVAEEMLSCAEPSVRRMVRIEAFGLLACTRLRLGDLDGAEAASREQLALAAADEVLAVEYLATIAALRGSGVAAARLRGFVRLLLSRRPNLGFDYPRTDDVLATSLKAQLSAGEIAAEMKRGEAYTVGQATAAALAAARIVAR